MAFRNADVLRLTEPRSDFNMKKILVIEDESAMRSNLRDILELENFSPLIAADGREGDRKSVV